MPSWDDLEGQILDDYLDSMVSKSQSPKASKYSEQDLLTIGEYQRQEYRDAIEFRKKYPLRIFILICIWLAFIAVIVVLSGLYETLTPFKTLKFGFHLPDMVLNVLLGSSTVTVVGLFGTVAGHFFNKSRFKNSD